MFNKSRLNDILAAYKSAFVSEAEHWYSQERYKWENVKRFQDNWDMNAPDFAEMLDRSLKKTDNLLASKRYTPRDMIVKFARLDPEAVRAMFTALFDEREDVFDRIDRFKTKSKALLKKYGEKGKNDFQDERAISTYLWLRYPDKYYIYKFTILKAVAAELEADCQFKQGAYTDNIRNFLKLYDEICAVLKEDSELVALFKSQLTESCYPDPELKTLTIDVGYYIYIRRLKSKK